MPITAELHDGRRLEFPDGTDPAVIQATVKKVLGQTEKPASVSLGDTLRQIPREVGLGARHLLEGVATIPEIVTEPLRQIVTDPIAKAMQPRSVSDLVTGAQPAQGQPLSKSASDLADYIGLPKPETPDERVVGDASRLVASSIGMTGAGRGVANLLSGAADEGKAVSRLAQLAAERAGLSREGARRGAEAISANPSAQALGAAAAGGAGGSVRESGGGPLEQFGAALAAGIAAPLSTMGVKKVVDAAGNVIKTAYNPQRVDVILEQELAKQGIDWASLGMNVRSQLRKDAQAAVYSGQPMNPQALARLADFRRVGATPLTGDLTQDPVTLTRQRNLAKQLANSSSGAEPGSLPQIQNQNAQAVLRKLDSAATSPLDEYATGQGIIKSVQGTEAAKTAETGALYSAARDSQGRSLPLVGAEFTKRANEALKQNLAPKLGAEVDEILNDIASGKTPLTVEYAEQLKTMLGRKQRSAADGDLRYAYGLVRQALDETPLQAGGPTLPGTAGQASVDAFNKARSAAREQFGWRESAKFVEDAIGGVPPDKFVRAHVIGSSVDDLTKLKAQVGTDPELVNGVRKQLVDYIMKRGRADSKTTTFSGAGLEDGLKAVGDRKLALFFSSEEIGQIKAAVNVARLSQSQPIGSAVNNSNSGALILGKVGDLLGKTADLPFVGPMISAPAQSLLLKAQAAPMRNIGSALSTTAEREPSLPAILPISALLAAPSAQARQQNDRR